MRSDRRLNLGCGFDKRPGYVNVDRNAFHEPDLVADVRELPLPDGQFTEALAIDVLEHLPRGDVERTLAEWLRVLAPDGQLRLRTVDAVGVARQLLAAEDTVAGHDRWLHNLYGTQAYEGDFHLSGFTDLTLIDQLARAGFDRIWVERRDGWLLDVTASRPAGRALPVAVGLDDGVYPAEAAPDGPFRWMTDKACLLVTSTAGAPVTVRVELAVSHPAAPGVLTARCPLWDSGDVEVGAEPVAWAPVVDLEPGRPLRIAIRSSAPRVDAPNDPRRLHAMLHRFAVSEV